MFEWFKASFEGFDGIAFPKEPILWLTFIAAVLNIVVQAATGDVTWWLAGETVVGLTMGFIGRGRVSPAA